MVDFAAHAASMDASSPNVDSIVDLQAVLKWAKMMNRKTLFVSPPMLMYGQVPMRGGTLLLPKSANAKKPALPGLIICRAAKRNALAYKR